MRCCSAVSTFCDDPYAAAVMIARRKAKNLLKSAQRPLHTFLQHCQPCNVGPLWGAYVPHVQRCWPAPLIALKLDFAGVDTCAQ